MDNQAASHTGRAFNGLDKRGAADVCALLSELKERKTILLAAHNLVNMEKLCDTVCEMDGCAC